MGQTSLTGRWRTRMSARARSSTSRRTSALCPQMAARVGTVTGVNAQGDHLLLTPDRTTTNIPLIYSVEYTDEESVEMQVVIPPLPSSPPTTLTSTCSSSTPTSRPARSDTKPSPCVPASSGRGVRRGILGGRCRRRTWSWSKRSPACSRQATEMRGVTTSIPMWSGTRPRARCPRRASTTATRVSSDSSASGWEPGRDYRMEAREYIDAGGSVVLVFRQSGIGRGSGVRTRARLLWRLRPQ